MTQGYLCYVWVTAGSHGSISPSNKSHLYTGMMKYIEFTLHKVRQVQTKTAWSQSYLYTQTICCHIIHFLDCDCSTFDLKMRLPLLSQGFVIVFNGPYI